MRYWLKGCTRCHGDLREEADIYGKYVSCMQCGYILRFEEEELLLQTGQLATVPVEVTKIAA